MLMRVKQYRWSLIFVFIMLMLLGTQNVYADQKELVTLEEKTDIIILVGYENTQPTIKIIGPDNTVYEQDEDYTVVSRTQGLDYYCIAEASQGKWFIDCDKKDNETVYVEVNRWYRSVTIESFSYEETADNEISVQIRVASDSNLNYDWYVYAVLKNDDGTIVAEKELKKAWGMANQNASTVVSTKELPDGDYYLVSEVVYEYRDGVEVSDRWESEEQITVRGNKQEETGTFITTLDLTNYLLTVEWSNLEEKGSYIAAIIQGNESEPLYYEKYESGDTYCEAFVDFENQIDPEVVLTPLNYDGSYDKQYKRTVLLDPGVKISVDTESVTAQQMLTISYDAGNREIPLEISVNGKQQKYRMNGSGIISTMLEDMAENKVELRYQTDENCYYCLSTTITVNSMPPFITLYGINDSIVTEDDKVAIAGLVEHASKLSVNGENVEIADDGTFFAEVEIKDSDEKIEFVGISENGVKSVRTIAIIHEKSEKIFTGSVEKETWNLFPLIISFCIALAIGLFLIILGAVMQRKMEAGKLVFRMITGFLIIGIIAGIIICTYCFIQFKSVQDQISGTNLVTVLKDSSYTGLQQRLEERSMWIERCRIIGLFTGLIFALLVILELVYRIGGNITAKIKNKKRTNPTKTRKYRFVSERKADIYCPECGTKNIAGARYCGKCGYSLIDDDLE